MLTSENIMNSSVRDLSQVCTSCMNNMFMISLCIIFYEKHYSITAL